MKKKFPRLDQEVNHLQILEMKFREGEQLQIVLMLARQIILQYYLKIIQISLFLGSISETSLILINFEITYPMAYEVTEKNLKSIPKIVKFICKCDITCKLVYVK